MGGDGDGCVDIVGGVGIGNGGDSSSSGGWWQWMLWFSIFSILSCSKLN